MPSSSPNCSAFCSAMAEQTFGDSRKEFLQVASASFQSPVTTAALHPTTSPACSLRASVIPRCSLSRGWEINLSSQWRSLNRQHRTRTKDPLLNWNLGLSLMSRDGREAWPCFAGISAGAQKLSTVRNKEWHNVPSFSGKGNNTVLRCFLGERDRAIQEWSTQVTFHIPFIRPTKFRRG